MNIKFLKCRTCNKLVEVIQDSDSKLICCNNEMIELIPGTIDASKEKHVPIYKLEQNAIEISLGEIEHPMQEEHYISFVEISSNHGIKRSNLKINQSPIVKFSLLDYEQVDSIYAYCNLHGLWKKDVK